MGLFDKIFKKDELQVFKDTDIVSPVTGKMIPANEISDPVFGEEMMGQTIGIIPSNGDVVCPVNGIVEVAFPTGHAFGIKGNDGNSYLVHIGIDTVSLNGNGFKMLLKQNQQVTAGQIAVEANLTAIKKSGLDTTTMLIVTEKEDPNFKVDYIGFQNVEKGKKINK